MFLFVPLSILGMFQKLRSLSLVLIALADERRKMYSLARAHTHMPRSECRALLLITESNCQTDFAITILVPSTHSPAICAHFHFKMLLNCLLFVSYQRFYFRLVLFYSNEHTTFSLLSQNKCQLLTQFRRCARTQTMAMKIGYFVCEDSRRNAN